MEELNKTFDHGHILESAEMNQIVGKVNEVIREVNEQIPEAPQDGKTYGRKSRAWSPITIPEGETIINIGEISKHIPEEIPLSIALDSVDLFDQYIEDGVYKFTLHPYHVIGMLLVNVEKTAPAYVTQILKFGESSIEMGSTYMVQCNEIYAYRVGKLYIEGYSWSEWKKRITSLE